MNINSSVDAGQAGQPPVFDSYGRLSWNPTTHELEKIETHHEDNRKTIARHGAVLGAELADGLSAWKKNVRRKDFEKLLERAEKGLSQGIAVWHVDRLFRQPRDLERLIDLADSGFMVIGSHGTRDLSNPEMNAWGVESAQAVPQQASHAVLPQPNIGERASAKRRGSN